LVEMYASLNPLVYRINLERRRTGGRKGGVDGIADGA
jgi:hypothetical protein